MKKIKNFFKFLFEHKFKIILILIIIAAAGFSYYKYKQKNAKNLDELITETITKGEISLHISKDGSVQPKSSIEVTSRADGRIKQMFVKEGDIVKQGQKLLIVQPGQSIHDKFLPVEVTAPMSGMVLRCLNERRSSQSTTTYDLPREGETITGSSNYGNATCIMKIVQPGKYVVPIKIGEHDISKIKIGMPAKISIISKPDTSYEGFISLISPQPEVKEEHYWDPDSNKVEFITVAETKGKVNEILIGLSANVKIDLESKDNILIVPNSAIYEENDMKTNTLSYYVYKKTGARKAKKTLIKLGLRDDNVSELLNSQEADLKEGDTLLVDIQSSMLEII